MCAALPYLPGQPPSRPSPLERYLPPLPAGVASAWLDSNFKSSEDAEGSFVLDPFGAAPRICFEIARAGYRVLVAANNPVARFLIELAANPPSREQLRGALADLASTRKGEERLEPHIRSLYLTHCDQCGLEVMAESFLWERGASGEAPVPFAKVYHCRACGEQGEHPATREDIERAAQFTGGGLHRARALERVTAQDDPDRTHVEEALSVYLPRAVYVLFTLINKLDSLSSSPGASVAPGERLRWLQALLLSTCDQANTLWPYPVGRARPRQLTIPPRFREKNIWAALEEAIDLWAAPENSADHAVPITIWPELPPLSGGICLFEGRLKSLVEQPKSASGIHLHLGAVLAAIPRPNQAFWTLSALWSGWLWGREAVGPFKSVLRRRRYDWGWHASALHAALEHLTPLIDDETLIFGLVGETESGFLSSAMVAAQEAGLKLQGIALRAATGQAQILWQRNPTPIRTEFQSKTPSNTVDLAAQAAVDYLQRRGEPAGYLHLHVAALSTLIQAADNGVPLSQMLAPAQSPPELMGLLSEVLEEAFSYRKGFLRFSGSNKSLEVGQWWLRDPENSEQKVKRINPLSDRVEISLVRALMEKPGIKLTELDKTLCAAFPGLFTPESELIQVCLDSYGAEEPAGSGRWTMRAEDSPRNRRAELKTGRRWLENIASHLGYQSEGLSPILLRRQDGEIVYACFILASAVVGKILFASPYFPNTVLLILPEERANLLSYKLQHNPLLRQRSMEGWRFLSFRQLSWLTQHHDLTPEVFNEQLTLDFLENSAPQMRLL